MGRRTCGSYQQKVRAAKYARQEKTVEENRIRKRKKHMKKHPNDKTLIGGDNAKTN